MFTIPTYDELEKKESDFNAERKGFSGSLFQKRKKPDSSDDLANINSEAVQIEKSVSKKKSIEATPTTSTEANEVEMIEKPVEKVNDNTKAATVDDDEDDDDVLLNMFIKKNNDIIDKPSPAKFAVPAIPTSIKFDPKAKFQRAEAPVHMRYLIFFLILR